MTATMDPTAIPPSGSSERRALVHAGLDADAVDRLAASIQRDIDNGVNHGAVALVARGGQIGYVGAFGHSDKATGRTAATDDVFLLMSTAKAYTAALVLRLIDQGRLAFHTKVAEIIPEFGIRGKQRVTVAHLLTHTSGTWSGFLPPPPAQLADLGDLSTLVAAFSAQQIAHRPGARVVYNPFASYVTLGEIVRRLDPSGRPFRQIAREDLFEPLEMTDSSFGLAVDHPRRVPLRMAESTPGAADVSVMESFNDTVDEHYENPAAMAFGTIADVFTFTEALRNRGTAANGCRLLSPALIDYAFRNHTADKSNEFWDFNKESRDIEDFPANFSYGGGYIRGEGDFLTPLGATASPRTFGAVGSGSTMWMVDPDRDLTFVFLSSGLLEGLNHFLRLHRLADLALAAAT